MMGEDFKGSIDVLIPTQGKRINGLIYQIQAFLNQSYKFVNVWVLVDSEDFNFIEYTIKRRLAPPYSRVHVINVPREWGGNYGHNPIRYAIERLPLNGVWLNTSGDDDCVMEWGMGHLIDNSDDVDLVIGKCIPTKRNHDYDGDVLGRDIELGKVTGSCCLYRTSKVKEIGYSSENYNADWILIEKMMEGNFRKIDSVIYVMPQSLGEETAV